MKMAASRFVQGGDGPVPDPAIVVLGVMRDRQPSPIDDPGRYPRLTAHNLPRIGIADLPNTSVLVVAM